nr:MAG TPA: hypothetical protein [Inoviridae sp.]
MALNCSPVFWLGYVFARGDFSILIHFKGVS